ncbi:MAG: discoidin domain-containing protein, partial [Oscillospiraceae bacterium]|nr:discoidin domain-containing protein [Oscillospiraceae bacterium]
MKAFSKSWRSVLSAILALIMVVGMFPTMLTVEAKAADGALTAVQSAEAKGNIVTVTFSDGITGKITFLEDDIFRYNVDPSGVFSEYATTVYGNTVKIPQYPDSYEAYSHPTASVSDADGYIVITAGDTTVKFEKSTAKMTVLYKGEVVMEEKEALVLGDRTTQTLVKNDGEDFFGGGTQNGRFIHTGESINIKNESNWVDGGVASPNPFYYSTEGYGVLRNTFLPGVYDFGKTEDGTVTAFHNENEFDAYYFLSDGETVTETVKELLAGYYHVTGAPVLLPEYAFYEAHLNAYNRDTWVDTNGTGGWKIYGSYASDGSEGVLSAYREAGQSSGYRIPAGTHAESLNGEGPTVFTDNFPETADTPYEFSARALLDKYVAMDMPLGYLLPNDGYGSGYGQNGYYMTGGVNPDGSSSDERIAAVDANVQNLKKFAEYARDYGIATGLWSQSYLTPDSNPNTYWHLLRDFAKEVSVAGVTSLKTDVAWVGYGYDMALTSQQSGYNTVSTLVGYRPNMITLDGWAGTQRFASVWTGDQYGGNWEYIRFHIPTYLGQSLSGNPNVGSDMDGIFGGSALISTRDTQWKIFTPTMLNMDGWGSYAKTPFTFGDPYTGINRMYLKLKAQLLPYLYTTAASASGMDTGNGDAYLPMVRAVFLEYPEDSYSATKNVQYQYLFGEYFLVAPIYTETEAIDAMGNDVRNGIYLPDEDQIWIDYFTGDQYYGGQILNNFDAPLWKLPVFVKNGAIVPMWEENNSPVFIDRTNRITEFWPDGSTEYTLFEDEGTYIENNQIDVDGYGKVNEIDYGTHVSTKYTSVVENGTATLTAEPSTGTYEGYDEYKNTTFIVNVSKEPSAVTAMNGDSSLTMVKMNSKDEVLNAELSDGEFAYYYDAAPALETYALEGEDEFTAMMDGKVSSPKLYVKFAETDSQANAQTLVLEGFENVDADLPANELDESLDVPANLHDVAEGKTPTTNVVSWDAVAGATGYEVLVDGIVNNVGDTTAFAHIDQDYNSTHTYAVRARGENGYSAWSEPIVATTLLDPWRNVPDATVSWNGGDNWGKLAYATDHDTGTMFHSTGDVVSSAEPFIFDFGAAYKLDKFEYYARSDNYGNGTVEKLDIFTSLDGVHWIEAHDGDTAEVWTYDANATVEENVKTVDLSGNAARYVKLIVRQSKGGFFSANELIIYKEDDTEGFAVGSTNLLPAVTEADYTNMNNYKGTSIKDGSVFVDQIQKRFGDINYNEIYDVYDYAFTAFPLNRGAVQTGSVSGNARYEVTEENGNLVIQVMADRVRNVNAFGAVLDYDPSKLEFVSVEPGDMTAHMVDFSVNMEYDDGTAYVNLAYFNKGNMNQVNGSGVLATITMRRSAAARSIEANGIDLSSLMLIGPDYSLLTVETDGSDGPITKVTKYGQSDVTITMTNDYLPTDDGSNVTKLIQQQTYNGLFDGHMTRDFEFMWDWEGNWDAEGKLPEHVALPVTMNVAFNEPSKLTEVTVYNANKSNGFVTKAEAVLNYTDGSKSEKIVLEADMSDYAPFEFVWEGNRKTVASVDITIQEAINYSGDQVTNMLTLAELELVYTEVEEPVKPAEPIHYGQSDVALTMTNAYLPTDDGSNVTKLIQQQSYDGLFNAAMSRDFEFLWDYSGNWDAEGKLPEYIALPVTMHVTFNEASPLTEVTVYNANKANGFVTKAEAVLNYSDGTTSEKLTIDAELVDYAPFAFVWSDNGKTVTSVDITILDAIKSNGDSASNMLTLAELELSYTKGTNTPEQPHEHEWSDWTVTTPATCTEAGVETRTCECGETETREIPALGHEYVNGKCTRCGDTLTSKF